MNTKRKCSLIIGVVFAFASTGTGQQPKSFLSVQDILSGWQANYGALKSMKVSYFEKIVSAEPPVSDPNIVKTLVKWIHVERVEEGKKFRARSSAAKEGFADIESVEETSFDGVYQRVYLPARKLGTIYVGVTKEGIGTFNLLKRYLLSEPYIERPSVESEDSVFSKTVRRGLSDPNFTISVRPVLEQVAGQVCHVLEVEYVRRDKNKEKATIIWVAHEKGMLPMKYQEFDSKGAITHEITVEQIDFAKTKDGGLWFPKKAFRVINLPTHIGVLKHEFDLLEFVPYIKVNTNTFRLDFPNGTHVFDTELGLNYIMGVKGY